MNHFIFNIERTFRASEKELSALKNIMKEEYLKRNEVFLKSGQVCHKLAFISKGSIRLLYDSPDQE